MRKAFMEKFNKEAGSATIEAVIAFVGFIFAIFTILTTVNFCRAQMLMSSAVDTAARELSQYAYFYQISGLQKFDAAVSEQASVGKGNINQVVGTVDSLYQTLGNVAEGTKEDAATLANATSQGDLDAQAIQNAITNLASNTLDIDTQIASVMQAFEHVGNDPLLYMRSLVAIAGEETMFLAKRALGAVLTKSFVQKHFGGSKEEANAALEKLGIEGGLDSVNFSLSMLFIDSKGDTLSAGQDIVLVATYKVKILQFFDWEVLEANLCKQAVCRAWLGGDDVQVYVDTTQTAVLPESGETDTPEENPETPDADPDDGEQQPGEDTETPGEGDSDEGNGDSGGSGGSGGETEEPKEDPPVDITGSYWYMDAFTRFNYMHNCLVLSKGLVSHVSDNYKDTVRGLDAYNRAYGFYQYIRCDEESAEDMATVVYGSITKYIKSQEDLYTSTNGEQGYEPGKVTEFIYVLYVPNNMTQEDMDKLKEAYEKEDYMLTVMNQQYGMDISVTIRVERCGGNYDYSKEGA